jgi:hypothetical protein
MGRGQVKPKITKLILDGGAAVLLLVACSGAPAAPVGAVLTPAMPSLADTAVPAATVPPATEEAAPTATVVPTLAPETATPPAEEAPLYKGIPHGVTADGFYYLGEADAPATMTDYSDFL